MSEPHYPLLQLAILHATRLHCNQDREGKSPLPYITHPIEVLSFVRFIGEVTDESVLCAAVLHDILEETETEAGEIEEKFGRDVCSLVLELTREEPTQAQIAGLNQDQVWDLRSKMLLDEIKKMSPRAMRVKLGDRLSNVIGAERSKPPKKLARYVMQSKEILAIIPRDVSPGLWDAILVEINR